MRYTKKQDPGTHLRASTSSRTIQTVAGLSEELILATVARICDPSVLCLLAQCCCLFRATVISAPATSVVWKPALTKLGWNDAGGYTIYKRLATLHQLGWTTLSLGGVDPLLFERSSAAGCVLKQEMVLFGGTVVGNTGPFLDDLLWLRLNGGTLDAGTIVQHGALVPGSRRGHSLTTCYYSQGEVAVLLGGWGYQEIDMSPLLLLPTADFPAACCWMAPEVTGQPPAPRAFHSCTQISPGVLLVFGGLGPGCCRADASVLTLEPTCRWEKLRISGIPHCVGGRAGHGAVLIESGLLFLAGASRSIDGDEHLGSVDLLQIDNPESPVRRAQWATGVWDCLHVPAVRCGTYIKLGGQLLAVGGVDDEGEHSDMSRLMAVDLQTYRNRLFTAVSARNPHGRSGAVQFPLGPHQALMISGADFGSSSQMGVPYLLHINL